MEGTFFDSLRKSWLYVDKGALKPSLALSRSVLVTGIALPESFPCQLVSKFGSEGEVGAPSTSQDIFNIQSLKLPRPCQRLR